MGGARERKDACFEEVVEDYMLSLEGAERRQETFESRREITPGFRADKIARW